MRAGHWKLFLAALLCAEVLSAQFVPGAKTLEGNPDWPAEMVAGISRYLDRELERVVSARDRYWRRDFSSAVAYEKSVQPNRARLAKIIGLVDARVPDVEVIYDAAFGRSSLVSKTALYEVHAVRWPVLPGVDAEGLLLEPQSQPRAAIVALPEADWSPEQLAGLAPGLSRDSQYARRFAEQGCRVLVATLINRDDAWSGNPRLRFTNQPHREFLHRMTYQMGRHIIGLEVQKVLAAVDWIEKTFPGLPIGVAGYGEGGLIALHAAASDTRIDAALVSGHFHPRENLWEEPIYRNVWSLLTEFGDAELASLVAPRPVVIEAVEGPQVAGPRPPTRQRRGAAPGRLEGPSFAAVQREFERARKIYERLGKPESLVLIAPPKEQVREPGPKAQAALLEALGQPWRNIPATSPRDLRGNYDPAPRLRRQFEQIVEFTQQLVRESALARQQFWSKADTSSLDAWKRTAEWYRNYYWDEVIGRLPPPSAPLEPRIREAPGTAKWRRFDVVLPVWPDVFAYGVLLLPTDLKNGEPRPVVVCQHGLDGRSDDLILPRNETARRVYGNFAAKLADRGFVVFVPQLPYTGEFRQLQRKANPLKLSIYSFILGQNQRILEWLSAQPFVDPGRIAFYGLSYGGKTALRVPPLLDQYVLSICSGDFNEWIWKVTTMDFAGSYMFTHEYEIMEFDTGNTFNHAELAMLMAPRPFMVERGHRDPVGIDEWVSFEYAKVRRFYDELGIGDRTTIEYFNGPHQIHGMGTFRFLHRFLQWPEPQD
jgi:hypothetical protein